MLAVSGNIRVLHKDYQGHVWRSDNNCKKCSRLTEEFKINVGLHQGSALSPFLFSIIKDKLTEDIRKDAPWDMLFADDIMLSRQNYRELEIDLGIEEMDWREEA